MNDQISRQRLIEELDELDHWTQFAEHWFRCDAVYSLIRRQPLADQWIPCSERLPQDEQDVLGTTDEGIVEKVWYNKHSKTWYGSPFTRRKTVTAWMPLPEPFKGEENV